MIQPLPNQYELVLLLALPLAVIQREALAAEVEDVATGAFLKPENALGAEYRRWHLVVEEILKLAD